MTICKLIEACHVPQNEYERYESVPKYSARGPHFPKLSKSNSACNCQAEKQMMQE